MCIPAGPPPTINILSRSDLGPGISVFGFGGSPPITCTVKIKVKDPF